MAARDPGGGRSERSALVIRCFDAEWNGLPSGYKRASSAENLWFDCLEIAFSQQADWNAVIQFGIEPRKPSLDYLTNIRGARICGHLCNPGPGWYVIADRSP